jgi:hypothetical protein
MVPHSPAELRGRISAETDMPVRFRRMVAAISVLIFGLLAGQRIARN